MRKSFIFFLYVVGIMQFKAQDKIDKAIQNLEQNYSQEKVYMLLDKNQYVVGDNIYFKSFVFEGYGRSSISTTLFVELYDRLKNVVDKKLIYLKNGEGSGSFSLKENLNEDIYFIRAYTAYMANFPEEFNFIKEIPIYNPNYDKRLVKEKNYKWTAGIFPEGGTFIDNIPTKIAVRIYPQGIPPASWSGYIIDSEKPNEKLVTFKGFDQNVSSFSITPKKGKIYKAIIEDDKAYRQTITLPIAAETGIALQVNSNSEGIQFTVKSNNLPEGLKGYTIIGTINNQLAYKANVKANSTDISSKIPIKASDDINGILQLSIFDEKENPVSQRLCFIKPKNLNIEVPNLDFSLNNTPRAFNSFDIIPEQDFDQYTVLVKDITNEPANSNKENILSSLWLTGDLPSSIYSPAQYFTKNANADALDALLISEQWKRYSWNALLQGKSPAIFYKPLSNLSFLGKVTNNGVAVADKAINLLFRSENTEKVISQAQTDDTGTIHLNNVNFDEPLDVSCYLNSDASKNEANSNISISFRPLVDFVPLKGNLPFTNYHLADPAAPKAIPDLQVAKALQNYQNQKSVHNDEIHIQEVTLKAKKKNPTEELEKTLVSGMFSSMDSTVFDFVNDNKDAQSSQNILQWLQGRAAGLTFTIDNSGNYIPYIRGSQAALYLDEIKTDPNMISSLPVSNIALVKILKGGGLISNAIAIYTKRGNMGSEDDDKKESANKTILKGYDKAADFELPDITGEAYKKITQDTRETLYWNPSLSEDAGLAPRVKFFNNDEAKNREITIISFDKNDRILYYDEVK